MPPVVHPGSRAPLITWIVILFILFVTATVFAFIYYGEAKQTQDTFNVFKTKYIPDFIAESALTSPEVVELKELRTAENSGFTRQDTVLDVAMKQRDRLARTITGAPAKASEARRAAEQTLGDAVNRLKEAGVQLPSSSENLTGAVAQLVEAVLARQQQVVELRGEVDAAKREVADTISRTTEQLTAKDKDIEAARSDAQSAIREAADDRSAKQTQIDDLDQAYHENRRVAEEAQQKVRVQIEEKDREIEELKEKLERIQVYLARYRGSVTGPIVRQADGRIIRMPGNNMVYINLGHGDQVAPGLTFEVYDKNDGIPGTTNGEGGDDSLPAGKASIEVIRVGATSSECRIIEQRRGQSITEGDLIANLIYDPNTKYNFFVYGNFDLDQNRIATPGDAEVVKRLITQWGGTIVDKINVDTDFVVMGKEPVLPEFSREDLEDPINKAKYDAAIADLDAYLEQRQNARDLHIPVLNQNRFLYMIGYYEMAQR